MFIGKKKRMYGNVDFSKYPILSGGGGHKYKEASNNGN